MNNFRSVSYYRRLDYINNPPIRTLPFYLLKAQPETMYKRFSAGFHLDLSKRIISDWFCCFHGF